jgi:hypothetical protein
MPQILKKILEKNKVEKIYVDEDLPEEIKKLKNSDQEKAQVIITGKECKKEKCVRVFLYKNKIKAFVSSFLNDLIVEKDIPVAYSIKGLKVGSLQVQYILLFMALIIPFATLTIPPDDLLRHLVSYKFNYDYHRIYTNCYLPAYNPHLTFEYIAGKIHQIVTGINLPQEMAIAVVQAVLITLLFLGIKLNTKTDK